MTQKDKLECYDSELKYKICDMKTFTIRSDDVEHRRAELVASCGNLWQTGILDAIV
jgi:hypothetical protein